MGTLAGLRGPTSKGRGLETEGKGEGKEEKWGKEGKERGKGKGRGGTPTFWMKVTLNFYILG